MATQTSRALVLDPFFDGDGSSRRPAGPPLPGNADYRDVSTERLHDDRPISDRMPSGPHGLRGVVIPHATPGGTVRGLEPHNVRDMQVVIDPHIEGQSSLVRLGDITPMLMEQATVMAAGMTPEPDSIQSQRLRGAAVMHSVSNLSRRGNDNAASLQAGPATVPSPNLGRMGQPVRTIKPLAAFSHTQRPQQPQQLQQRADHAPRAHVAAPVPVAVEAPSVDVVFEIEHFGTHQAAYHDVIIEPGFIVLVYTSAYRGSKYFPEAKNENSPPLALNIVGRPEVYLVHTTGVHYAYGGTEFCVLLVEQSGTLDQPGNAAE